MPFPKLANLLPTGIALDLPLCCYGLKCYEQRLLSMERYASSSISCSTDFSFPFWAKASENKGMIGINCWCMCRTALGCCKSLHLCPTLLIWFCMRAAFRPSCVAVLDLYSDGNLVEVRPPFHVRSRPFSNHGYNIFEIKLSRSGLMASAESEITLSSENQQIFKRQILLSSVPVKPCRT